MKQVNDFVGYFLIGIGIFLFIVVTLPFIWLGSKFADVKLEDIANMDLK
jgi:hypothetical protein